MKAILKYFSKTEIRGRYVVELSIHEVATSDKYPDGVKYGLICKDLKSGQSVLFDNHHPKGPHFHINEQEFEYLYVSDDRLIADFKATVWIEMGVRI